MKKRILLLIALVLATGGLLTLWLLTRNPNEASPSQLKTKLGCERVTADYRETDPLCSNLSYASQLSTRDITFTSSAKPDTGTITLVLITTGDTTKPLAKTTVGVYLEKNTECAKRPCDTTYEKVTDLTTDDLGVISLRRSSLPTKETQPTLGIVQAGHRPTLVPLTKTGPQQYLVTIH